MKELLTMGDVTEEFNRLGIIVRQTYNGEDYGICEVTEEEFKILCDEPDIEGTWEDCGWRYCEGSNQCMVNAVLSVKNKELKCWFEPAEIDYENLDENYEEDDYIPQYSNLLAYLCEQKGCSQPRNVCALTKDLAKYNNMTMAELFKAYQG